jgi:hypothetical protein
MTSSAIGAHVQRQATDCGTCRSVYDKRAKQRSDLIAKANEPARLDDGSVIRKPDGSPMYKVGDLEHVRLLRAAKGIDDSLNDNRTLLARAVAKRHLYPWVSPRLPTNKSVCRRLGQGR